MDLFVIAEVLVNNSFEASLSVPLASHRLVVGQIYFFFSQWAAAISTVHSDRLERCRFCSQRANQSLKPTAPILSDI